MTDFDVNAYTGDLPTCSGCGCEILRGDRCDDCEADPEERDYDPDEDRTP